jgi:hypothetical protein
LKELKVSGEIWTHTGEWQVISSRRFYINKDVICLKLPALDMIMMTMMSMMLLLFSCHKLLSFACINLSIKIKLKSINWFVPLHL